MYALITGASSGIGREFALMLAQKGYNLILVARRADRLSALKEVLQHSGCDVVIKSCDVSIAENIVKLHEECKSYDIGILINNAGFGKLGFFSDLDLAGESGMIRTNVEGLYLMTKLFSADMERGYILNVASSAGFQPDPKMAVYGATKAFVLDFSQAIGYEFKRQGKGIFVSVLCPGPVDTEFNSVAGGSFKIRAMTAEKCAHLALKGMFAGKRVIVPGFKMKSVSFFSRLIPSKLLLRLTYNIQNKKETK